MVITKEVTIGKGIEEVWEVLGNQFGQIDKWSSLISKSSVGGPAKVAGLDYSVRSTQTTSGATQQEMKSFDPKQHRLAYRSRSGTPFFIDEVNADWSLSTVNDKSTRLKMSVDVQLKGLAGMLLKPIAKKKLGGLGNDLVEELKYYVENGAAHPRKKKMS